jgi:hypothetical protein
MSETTTWYIVRKRYVYKNGPLGGYTTWEIIPVQVSRATDKTIWIDQADGWLDGRQQRLDGSQFDNLEAANSCVKDRLAAAYDSAAEKLGAARDALQAWEDVK